MLGLWYDDYIELSDGTIVDSMPQKLLAFAMHLEEDIDVYYYQGARGLDNYIAYMLQGFRPNHRGGSNTFNVLCGVNRMIYHVTYTNTAGYKLRILMFANLIPVPPMALGEEFGGNSEQESAMLALHAAEDMGIRGITIGSFALQHFRRDMGIAKYYERFPQIPEQDLHDMRVGYLGGYVMAIPGEYGRCTDWDCNGMYASILRNSFLPFGAPVSYEGAYQYDKDMPLHIDVMTFRADLKSDGHPFLSAPRFAFDDASERMLSTHGYITMPLTNIDQELLFDNYDVSVYSVKKGWKFRQSKGFFKLWVDNWNSIKEHSRDGRRAIAKRIPNSLVGKFGTVPRHNCLMPSLRDGQLLWTVETYDKTASNYLPLAMYVTAIGRQRLFAAMKQQKARVIYANTDGFMIDSTDVVGIEQDPKKIGKWKCEGDYTRMIILGTGLYQGLRTDGMIDLISSGISRNTAIPWEQFKRGNMIIDDYGQEIVL